MTEALALAAVVAALEKRWAPDWGVAGVGALLMLAAGAVTRAHARAELSNLGPTIAFLAALLVLADGCRRAGLFDWLGAVMASAARGSPRRLLMMVFVMASLTTAVLSLDATVLLLTPIVFVTAARTASTPRPHVYACTHLANSASLLLPVSNLTNLLAFQASGLTFARFGALMALPWATALSIEWFVLSRAFAHDLDRDTPTPRAAVVKRHAPVVPLALLAATLLGFSLSSVIGLSPAWVAAAGAAAFVVSERGRPLEIARAAHPAFLLFVLALGVVVRAAGDHGLASVVSNLIPHGSSFLDLIKVAAASAIVANLVNNLPATLIILPAAVVGGAGAALAMLIGVGVGPNLTYVGSLATLLWRRVLHAHDESAGTGEFTRLGLLIVPPALVACTAALWIALRVL